MTSPSPTGTPTSPNHRASPLAAAELLQVLMHPRSVALVGASNNLTKLITARPLEYLRRYRFEGQIYPVNPRHDTIQGLPAYPSVTAIPDTVDLVMVALPREHVLDVLTECAEARVRAAIVFTSGFGEVPDGHDLQHAITELSERTGMAVLGPNCQGVANLATGCFPCFSTAFATDTPEIDGTAIVSQSGAVAAMIYNKLLATGGGAKYWASTGNEADLTVARVIQAVLEDTDVHTVLGYLESVRDPEILATVAHRAEQLGKTVILVRPATTARGWTAATRHTGAGVNDPTGHGARLPTGPALLRADSLEDMVALAQLARTNKTPTGNRIALISNSGGLGVMMADSARAADLAVADLEPATSEALSGFLPGFASTANPVDVTAQLLNDNSLLSRALPALAGDAGVDVVLVGLGAVGEGYDVDQIVTDLVQASRTTPQLYVVAWVGSRLDVRQQLGSQGVPVFDDVSTAIAAIQAYTNTQKSVRVPQPPCRGPGFNDLALGMTLRSAPTILREPDLDHYAAAARQAGDNTNIHVNPGAARDLGFRTRIAAGLHTLTFLSILGEDMGLWEHASILAGFDRLRFHAPVYPDDTLTLELTVTALKPSLRRAGSGIVTFAFRLTAQSAGTTPAEAVTGQVSYVFDPRPQGTA